MEPLVIGGALYPLPLDAPVDSALLVMDELTLEHNGETTDEKYNYRQLNPKLLVERVKDCFLNYFNIRYR
jgi:hypothetical protein